MRGCVRRVRSVVIMCGACRRGSHLDPACPATGSHRGDGRKCFVNLFSGPSVRRIHSRSSQGAGGAAGQRMDFVDAWICAQCQQSSHRSGPGPGEGAFSIQRQSISRSNRNGGLHLKSVPRPVRDAEAVRHILGGPVVARHCCRGRPGEVVVKHLSQCTIVS